MLALHQSLRLAAQLGENNWVAENFEGPAAVAQQRGVRNKRLGAGGRRGPQIQDRRPDSAPGSADVDALTLEVRRS